MSSKSNSEEIIGEIKSISGIVYITNEQGEKRVAKLGEAILASDTIDATGGNIQVQRVTTNFVHNEDLLQIPGVEFINITEPLTNPSEEQSSNEENSHATEQETSSSTEEEANQNNSKAKEIADDLQKIVTDGQTTKISNNEIPIVEPEPDTANYNIEKSPPTELNTKSISGSDRVDGLANDSQDAANITNTQTHTTTTTPTIQKSIPTELDTKGILGSDGVGVGNESQAAARSGTKESADVEKLTSGATNSGIGPIKNEGIDVSKKDELLDLESGDEFETSDVDPSYNSDSQNNNNAAPANSENIPPAPPTATPTPEQAPLGNNLSINERQSNAISGQEIDILKVLGYIHNSPDNAIQSIYNNSFAQFSSLTSSYDDLDAQTRAALDEFSIEISVAKQDDSSLTGYQLGLSNGNILSQNFDDANNATFTLSGRDFYSVIKGHTATSANPITLMANAFESGSVVLESARITYTPSPGNPVSYTENDVDITIVTNPINSELTDQGIALTNTARVLESGSYIVRTTATGQFKDISGEHQVYEMRLPNSIDGQTLESGLGWSLLDSSGNRVNSLTGPNGEQISFITGSDENGEPTYTVRITNLPDGQLNVPISLAYNNAIDIKLTDFNPIITNVAFSQENGLESSQVFTGSVDLRETFNANALPFRPSLNIEELQTANIANLNRTELAQKVTELIANNEALEIPLIDEYIHNQGDSDNVSIEIRISGPHAPGSTIVTPSGLIIEGDNIDDGAAGSYTSFILPREIINNDDYPPIYMAESYTHDNGSITVLGFNNNNRTTIFENIAIEVDAKASTIDDSLPNTIDSHFVFHTQEQDTNSNDRSTEATETLGRVDYTFNYNFTLADFADRSQANNFEISIDYSALRNLLPPHLQVALDNAIAINSSNNDWFISRGTAENPGNFIKLILTPTIPDPNNPGTTIDNPNYVRTHQGSVTLRGIPQEIFEYMDNNTRLDFNAIISVSENSLVNEGEEAHGEDITNNATTTVFNTITDAPELITSFQNVGQSTGDFHQGIIGIDSTLQLLNIGSGLSSGTYQDVGLIITYNGFPEHGIKIVAQDGTPINYTIRDNNENGFEIVISGDALKALHDSFREEYYSTLEAQRANFKFPLNIVTTEDGTGSIQVSAESRLGDSTSRLDGKIHPIIVNPVAADNIPVDLTTEVNYLPLDPNNPSAGFSDKIEIAIALDNVQITEQDNKISIFLEFADDIANLDNIGFELPNGSYWELVNDDSTPPKVIGVKLEGDSGDVSDLLTQAHTNPLRVYANFATLKNELDELDNAGNHSFDRTTFIKDLTITSTVVDENGNTSYHDNVDITITDFQDYYADKLVYNLNDAAQELLNSIKSALNIETNPTLEQITDYINNNNSNLNFVINNLPNGTNILIPPNTAGSELTYNADGVEINSTTLISFLNNISQSTTPNIDATVIIGPTTFNPASTDTPTITINNNGQTITLANIPLTYPENKGVSHPNIDQSIGYRTGDIIVEHHTNNEIDLNNMWNNILQEKYSISHNPADQISATLEFPGLAVGSEVSLLIPENADVSSLPTSDNYRIDGNHIIFTVVQTDGSAPNITIPNAAIKIMLPLFETPSGNPSDSFATVTPLAGSNKNYSQSLILQKNDITIYTEQITQVPSSLANASDHATLDLTKIIAETTRQINLFRAADTARSEEDFFATRIPAADNTFNSHSFKINLLNIEDGAIVEIGNRSFTVTGGSITISGSDYQAIYNAGRDLANPTIANISNNKNSFVAQITMNDENNNPITPTDIPENSDIYRQSFFNVIPIASGIDHAQTSFAIAEQGISYGPDDSRVNEQGTVVLRLQEALLDSDEYSNGIVKIYSDNPITMNFNTEGTIWQHNEQGGYIYTTLEQLRANSDDANLTFRFNVKQLADHLDIDEDGTSAGNVLDRSNMLQPRFTAEITTSESTSNFLENIQGDSVRTQTLTLTASYENNLSAISVEKNTINNIEPDPDDILRNPSEYLDNTAIAHGNTTSENSTQFIEFSLIPTFEEIIKALKNNGGIGPNGEIDQSTLNNILTQGTSADASTAANLRFNFSTIYDPQSDSPAANQDIRLLINDPNIIDNSIDVNNPSHTQSHVNNSEGTIGAQLLKDYFNDYYEKTHKIINLFDEVEQITNLNNNYNADSDAALTTTLFNNSSIVITGLNPNTAAIVLPGVAAPISTDSSGNLIITGANLQSFSQFIAASDSGYNIAGLRLLPGAAPDDFTYPPDIQVEQNSHIDFISLVKYLADTSRFINDADIHNSADSSDPRKIGGDNNPYIITIGGLLAGATISLPIGEGNTYDYIVNGNGKIIISSTDPIGDDAFAKFIKFVASSSGDDQASNALFINDNGQSIIDSANGPVTFTVTDSSINKNIFEHNPTLYQQPSEPVESVFIKPPHNTAGTFNLDATLNINADNNIATLESINLVENIPVIINPDTGELAANIYDILSTINLQASDFTRSTPDANVENNYVEFTFRTELGTVSDNYLIKTVYYDFPSPILFNTPDGQPADPRFSISASNPNRLIYRSSDSIGDSNIDNTTLANLKIHLRDLQNGVISDGSIDTSRIRPTASFALYDNSNPPAVEIQTSNLRLNLFENINANSDVLVEFHDTNTESDNDDSTNLATIRGSDDHTNIIYGQNTVGNTPNADDTNPKTTTIIGGNRDDYLFANYDAAPSSSINIYGRAGNDQITGGAGIDNIYAGADDDIVNAGAGNDYIDAGAGDDTVNAGAGNDYIDAGAGDDTVNAGAGNDYIDGGTGYNILSGGAGNDVFKTSLTNSSDISNTDNAAALFNVDQTTFLNVASTLGLNAINPINHPDNSWNSPTSHRPNIFNAAIDWGNIDGTDRIMHQYSTTIHHGDPSRINYGGANNQWDIINAGTGMDKIYARGQGDVINLTTTDFTNTHNPYTFNAANLTGDSQRDVVERDLSNDNDSNLFDVVYGFEIGIDKIYLQNINGVDNSEDSLDGLLSRLSTHTVEIANIDSTNLTSPNIAGNNDVGTALIYTDNQGEKHHIAYFADLYASQINHNLGNIVKFGDPPPPSDGWNEP